jgi:hypothetical protein
MSKARLQVAVYENSASQLLQEKWNPRFGSSGHERPDISWQKRMETNDGYRKIREALG